MDVIHTYLREWRIFADLTQDELGRRLGISGAQVSRIESGRRACDLTYLIEFKTVVNKAMDDHPHGQTDPDFRIFHYADPLKFKPDLIGHIQSSPMMTRRVAEWAEDMAELLERRALQVASNGTLTLLKTSKPTD